MKRRLTKRPKESLYKFSKDLTKLGKVTGARIAKVAAKRLTAVAQSTYQNSEDPYGIPWEPSVSGDAVDLVETGVLKKFVVYKATGEQLRVSVAAVRYAKYQIGKRRVFPAQGAELPRSYLRELERSTNFVFSEGLDY